MLPTVNNIEPSKWDDRSEIASLACEPPIPAAAHSMMYGVVCAKTFSRYAPISNPLSTVTELVATSMHPVLTALALARTYTIDERTTLVVSLGRERRN